MCYSEVREQFHAYNCLLLLPKLSGISRIQHFQLFSSGYSPCNEFNKYLIIWSKRVERSKFTKETCICNCEETYLRLLDWEKNGTQLHSWLKSAGPFQTCLEIVFYSINAKNSLSIKYYFNNIA